MMNNNKFSSITILLLMILALCVACQNKTETGKASSPPAKVENAVKESELTTVKLSPEAEQRLGIQTTKVEYRKIPRALKLGGEVIPIPGRSAVISTPWAGKIINPTTELLRVGAHVQQGQEIFRLVVLPAEKDAIGAREEVDVKRAQLELAQSKANRAEQLLIEKAVAQKTVEEARTEVVNAEAAYKAAQARLNMLNNKSPDAGAEGLSTMKLTAPVEGVLQKVHVSVGQIVPASTAAFEVSSQNPVWIRVPIYVGDLETIDTKSGAQIQPLGEAKNDESRIANPVQGPSLSDPNAASADLYYQMKNEDGRFRLNQKIIATIIQKTEEEGLTVPVAAIVYDVHGGTWVYVRREPQIYQRTRVEFLHIVDDNALLANGPDPGTEVVIAGVAELFGTEFGAGK